jgi:gliding motility-associated-like protein
MRKFCLLCTLVLTLLACSTGRAQDFSNRGKEFWLAYSYHVGMVNTGGSPVMTLYITSPVSTTYTVEIYGLTTLASGNINAGQVVTVDIPTTYFINNEGVFNNRAIRVTAQKPVVVYSYITRNAASGATLCLPTAVLGREYVSMNYTQISNESNSSSFITIVAVEDNTNVEITPSGDTKNGWVGGNKYTVSLNKGQVYQILGAAKTTNTGIDLTGSLIRSVPSATGGCKKIAVFSGSGKISIGCASAGSSDNLYQQLYPVATWGKKYLTVPSFNRPNAIYRVAKNNPATNVYVNGTLVPAGSFIGNYYEFTSSAGTRVEADQPICVAQYFTTQGCGGNGSPFDPDMIILNPVEQNIDSVTLVSSNLVAATSRQHHLHVIIKNAGTALQSFRLDGNAVPAAQWNVHPADPAYSYAYFNNVAQGYHTLSSDTGFNALAYGYADAETYGYSAGSNIKDQYQYISSTNQFATVNFAAAGCKGAPFSLAMTFPYQPTELSWQFNGLFPDVNLVNPAFSQTSVVNGKTLYTYALSGTYTLAAAGSYPIKIVALNPTADGCSGVQEMEYDLQVYDPPKAEFNFTTNGCVTTPVSFADNSIDNNNRAIVHRYWNFGDGNSQTNVANPSHTFTIPGAHDVRYTIINDIGCKADTVLHQVVLNAPPVADFTIASTSCAGKAVTFKDASTAGPSSAIAKWTWNFGDATPVVTATSNADQLHTFAIVGTYNVSLQLETATGCISNPITKLVTVNPNPVVDFSIPNVCLPAGTAQFNSLSTISDGTQALFTYAWNFGDASPVAGGSAPVHNYTAAGPFNVSLEVTSNNGCIASASKPINTIYAEPVADFTAPAEVCLGAPVNFTDASIAANSSITQWTWNFGNSTGSTSQSPSVTYATPGTYQVTLSVTSAIGCQSVTKTKTVPVVVNALPVAGFNVSVPGCAGSDVVFNNASSSASGSIVKWTWDYGDGGNSVLNNGNSFPHVYAAANTYPATLQVETDKGCVSTTVTNNVVINPVPVAGFTPPVICVNDLNAPFADESTIASGSVTGWQWNFGDPNANAGNPNTSAAQNAIHHYTMPGDYIAQFIATSNAGCKDTVEHTVTVNGAILTPSFSIQNTTALCSNKDINIKDASQIDAGKIVRLEIFWDADDLTIKTVDNDPQFGESYTHTYPEFGSPATRVYKVRYDVWSGINCVQSFIRDIELLATPILAFDAALPVCSNAPAFQLGVQQLNALTGQGSFSGTGVTPSGLFNPAISGSGSHTVIYTYNADNGCSNSVTKLVDIFPTPKADAGPDKVVLEGGKVTLTPKLITNIPVTYQWTPADYLSNASIAAPDASPDKDIYYKLTVTSDKGCTTTDEVFVELLRTPVIPNIFSPNGDGIHDKWQIDHLESYPGCVVEIYNRYGQLIHRIVNYTTPWDGRINGKDAPIGTYYYIINPKNGRKPITGFVDIIR